MPKRARKKKKLEEINASSMADIAFLLLVFFLVTTTVITFEGIDFVLPKAKDPNAEVDETPTNKRNQYKIILNSSNGLLVQDQMMDVSQLKGHVKEFIDNRGVDPNLSTKPSKAVISFRVDRGTTYDKYIGVIDQVNAAYNELRADFLQISVDEFLELDVNDSEHNAKLKLAQKEYPYLLSEAEPTEVN